MTYDRYVFFPIFGLILKGFKHHFQSICFPIVQGELILFYAFPQQKNVGVYVLPAWSPV